MPEIPKKKIVQLAQTGMLLQAASLAALVWLGHATPERLVLWSLFAGMMQALDLPTRLSYIKELTGPEDLANAVALNSMQFNLARALGPALANQNLCVYSIDYGAAEPGDWFKGVGPVDESAQRIADFVKFVKTTTGGDKVTLVGHSQGGLIGFYYLKMLQGAAHVDRFVALAPSVNGTSIAKTPNRDNVEYCLACADQHPRSALLRELKTGPIAMPNVQYSVLVTKNDKVVVPVENQFVKEPGVQNIYIQDLLPGKRVSHSGMLYDTETVDLIVKLVQGQSLQTASN